MYVMLSVSTSDSFFGDVYRTVFSDSNVIFQGLRGFHDIDRTVSTHVNAFDRWRGFCCTFDLSTFFLRRFLYNDSPRRKCPRCFSGLTVDIVCSSTLFVLSFPIGSSRFTNRVHESFGFLPLRFFGCFVEVVISSRFIFKFTPLHKMMMYD